MIILCNPQYNPLLWGKWPTGHPYSHIAPSKANGLWTVRKMVQAAGKAREGLVTDNQGGCSWVNTATSRDNGGSGFQSTLGLSDTTWRAVFQPEYPFLREIWTR